MMNSAQIKEVDYSQFNQMVESHQIGEVQVETNQLVFTSKDGKTTYRTGRIDDQGLVDRLLAAKDIAITSKIVEQTSPLLSFLLYWVLPILLFVALGQMLMKRMAKGMGGANAMMFGKPGSGAKVYVKSVDGIKFADVAGEDEAKDLLREIVDFLHNPGRYREIGASMPKGALLVGPPGTGKTLLAKAVAGEADVPFFSMSGSEFVEMFVGMGAAKVRDLFKQANEKAPCIVFIDEIDAIGQKRDGRIGGNDEREQTLNQLLTEMDGFDGTKGRGHLGRHQPPGIPRPRAFCAPAGSDRRVPVELPDQKGREEILKVHAKKIKYDPNIDFARIARAATGTSGAELANIVNEAALRAVREGRNAGHPGGPRGIHRGRHRGLSEEKPHPLRPRAPNRRLSRNRPRARRGEAGQLCAGS